MTYRLFKDLIQNNEEFLMQKTGETKNSVLHLAARFGHIELLAFIIELLPDLVSIGNIKGETPLHETCCQGNTNVVKLLVEANPYVIGVLDSEEHEVLSPLHVSIAEGYVDIVETILKGCPRLAWKVDNNGLTSMLSEYIIRNTAVDVNFKNQRGQTALDILNQRRTSDLSNMLKSLGGRTSIELFHLTLMVNEIDSETTATTLESPRAALEQDFEMLFEGNTHPGSDQ
ncbi:ankyrin repeat-containing protein At5g02620-like [Rosa chinensis]|uniref:ankyrin repeat-containing protein At5g02620-like n=1 Tax=Rosa chinensis TaxID=74649 RepID=UPI001AD8A256|nr:ankyrin repeat-containing protein At5g02620-like [Rosa chinensis]